MTNLSGTLARIYGLYNASQASLATRTTERDSARNSLYVSGVYLSGQTWQAKDATDLANYNAEVTLYNGMVADRDTWQGRANNAWGSSRVWNSGTSFEARLPPTLDVLSANFSTLTVSASNANTQMGSVTTDRAGVWIIRGLGHNNADGSRPNNDDVAMDIVVGGVVQVTRAYVTSTKATDFVSYFRTGVIASGTVLRIDMRQSRAAAMSLASGSIEAVFVPTDTNPN